MHGSHLLASILGLLTTSCDSFLTRQKEIEYVWKRPLQITFVRCLFISVKYLAFLIHILWMVWFPGHQPTHHHCMIWIVFQFLSCYTMLFILELILSIRVFALYEQSLKMGVFLWTMLAARTAGTIYHYFVWVHFHYPELKFSSHCLPTISTIGNPISVGYPVWVFIIGEIVVHLIIHGLALKRTAWDLRRYTFSGPPLVSVLNRDGLKVFTAISVGMAAIGISMDKKGIHVLFIYPLLISLVSTLGCRTILNLQTLNVIDISSSKENMEMEFTTINSLSTWDTRSEAAEEVI